MVAWLVGLMADMWDTQWVGMRVVKTAGLMAVKMVVQMVEQRV